VPDGWVVIEVCHNQACDGDGDNAVVIKRPGRREVVWLDCAIPEGYTETKRSHSARFPGSGDNARTIERSKP
jgi:hypothetical protein